MFGVTVTTITLLTILIAKTIRLIGVVAIARAFIVVINASVNSMQTTVTKTKEQIYLEYITELRRLKNLKYGEQLEFQFEEKALVPTWRNKKKQNPEQK